MIIKLKSKTAFVTGRAIGIWKDIVKSLANSGTVVAGGLTSTISEFGPKIKQENKFFIFSIGDNFVMKYDK